MKILWIGTGVMGAPMAGHLLDAGNEVAVSTRTRAKAAELEARGATWADDLAKVASEADVVCTMLGYPDDVESVVLGEGEGVLHSMKPGSLFIDFTTSRPELAVRIAEAGEKRGVLALDAPVSGGDVGARNGALSIMVGGSRGAFDMGTSILDVLGKTIVYQGEAGSGQHTKMVNQILIASYMVGVCEALVYAQRSGVDPETVLKSVSGGAAASWALSNLAPRILKGDLEPGFYVEHFIKDMEIALSECDRMGLELPGLALGRKLYEKVVELGMSRKGTQALIRALESMNPE